MSDPSSSSFISGWAFAKINTHIMLMYVRVFILFGHFVILCYKNVVKCCDWHLITACDYASGCVGGNTIPWLRCPAANDVTTARWQHSHPGNFGFIFVQNKEEVTCCSSLFMSMGWLIFWCSNWNTLSVFNCWGKKMCLRSNMYTKTPQSQFCKTVPTNRNTGLHLNSGIIRLTCFSEWKSPQCQILVRATQRHGRALWDPDKPVTARQSVEQGEKFEMFYGAVMGFCAQSSILWGWWNVTSATMRSFSFWNHPAAL